MTGRIDEARKASARFYRADLHVHSPLSYDWKNDSRGGYTPNPLLNRIRQPEDISEAILVAYYQAIEAAGLEVVAITDHMKWSFGVALSEYSKRHDGSVLILPGIEINAKFDAPLLRDYRIHILAIFPPDIGKTKIDRIFPEPFPDEFSRDGQKHEVEFKSIDHLVKEVHALNGHVIAAHIYGANGVRLAYTNQANLILKTIESAEKEVRDALYQKIGEQLKDELYRFDCLQVTETTSPVHFRTSGGEQAIPLICCSDSHHISQIGDPDRITYVKMGPLDFNSFSEALKYPDTRIRFRSNLPETKPPRIRGLRIIGRKDDDKSFFKDLIVGFSDNLTCLVGPRGSGKSAIIDAIRYAMGYNRSLGEVERVRTQVVDRQKNTLRDSRIEILYEKADTEVNKIVATYDEREDYVTQVHDLDDNVLNIPDVEAIGEYPLNLYGWNELELLGEDPRSQRDSLDRFIRELPKLKTERAELYGQLEENTSACSKHLSLLDKFFDPALQKTSFLRLREYETDFTRLNTPEMEKTFQRLDSIRHKLTFTSRVRVQLEAAAQESNLAPILAFEGLLTNQEEEKDWCEDLVEKRLRLRDYNDLATKHNAELSGKLNGYLSIVEKTEENLQEDLNIVQKEIKQTVGEEQSITADLRNNAKNRLEAAKDQFALYTNQLSQFEKLMEERRGIIERIKAVNDRVFAARNREISEIVSKIQVVEDEGFKISLRLEQARDRRDFLKQLQSNAAGLIYEGQYKRRKIPDILCDKVTPFGLSEAILNEDGGALQHSVTLRDGQTAQNYEIDKQYAQKLISQNCPREDLIELRTKRYITEKIKVLFRIEQIPCDDDFYIVLNDRPIQFCSPGQRCSAMLPLVTLTTDAPIIIDQPEDNLDNRLVSRAVFKILSKLKESRQIIVATHNPNILVSGDSEQVIVLKSDGGIEDCGSIDKRSIVTNIIELMEGGKEAFQRRQAKYGIRSKAGTR